jgi:2-iminobutanoate/2-iminopropanoate deaminase
LARRFDTCTRLPRDEALNRLGDKLLERKGDNLPDHRETVTAPDAPEAVGPYVHAVRAGDLLFCSGQIPLDPRTGDLVGHTAADQAGRCLENLAAVCHAAGATLGDAIKVTIYVTNMADFASINEVYASFFESSPPARVTVGVAALPRGAQVEMDAVVALGG